MQNVFNFIAIGENSGVNMALRTKTIIVTIGEEDMTNNPDLNILTAKEVAEQQLKDLMPLHEGWSNVTLEHLTT